MKTNPPLGSIEPCAQLLERPSNDTLLYKITTIENLLRSIDSNYLYFNRVDMYMDFEGADLYDGKQPPKDFQISDKIKFEKAPDYSAADYYSKSRSRTYACCFSLENSKFIWDNYANGSSKGKVCIVLNFGKLREYLNKTFYTTKAFYNKEDFGQPFSLHYGNIEYINWVEHQECKKQLPNSIKYTYLKDKKFSDEKELRISLSSIGIGEFVSGNDIIDFPDSLQFPFDFRKANMNNIITKLLISPDCDVQYLKAELNNRNDTVVFRNSSKSI